MNFNPRVVLLLAAIFALPTTFAFAAKGKPKSKGKPAAAQPSANSPAAALAPYINNVDPLLSLHRPQGKKASVALEQAPGRVATLRQQFVAERGAVGEGDRAKFDAAIATCDALTRALDERQKVLGDVRASQAVQGSGKLEAGPRKDNLTQGIKGGSTAKAVGAVVERDREKAAAKKAAKTAAANDDALTAMSVNRWNKRSVELRKQITDAYAGIK